ncbi:MAG TPA: hypothetical protein VKZ50_22095 [bacterium]|nr:hypothetical protein [bacterium]
MPLTYKHCLVDSSERPILPFMAPHWRRAGGPRQIECRGSVTDVVYNNHLSPAEGLTQLEHIPVLGWLFTAIYVVVANGVWIPISLARFRRLRSLVRPDLDYSIFLGPLECEIAPDRNFDANADWRPPIGRDVRIFGENVIDLGHDGEAPDDPPDGKREIHPIHWLAWEYDRSPSNDWVRFRVTILSDVSGRFPPYQDSGGQGAPINAVVRFSLAHDVWPGVSLKGQVISASVEHTKGLPYHQDAADGAMRQIDQDTFEFSCSIQSRRGLDAEICQTTNRADNHGGFWDGYVRFHRGVGGAAIPPAAPPPGRVIRWRGDDMNAYHIQVATLPADPGVGYKGPCDLFRSGSGQSAAAVCRGTCPNGRCRLVIEPDGSDMIAHCRCQ